jgi:hypothetical protein
MVSQLYFSINLKNRTPLLATVQKESEGSPTPAVETEESETAILHSNDFVLLNDDIKCWIVWIEDISLLEACCNCTLVHFFDDRLLIRRTLGDCERRLDSSIFFRASRGCGSVRFASLPCLRGRTLDDTPSGPDKGGKQIGLARQVVDCSRARSFFEGFSCLFDLINQGRAVHASCNITIQLCGSTASLAGGNERTLNTARNSFR